MQIPPKDQIISTFDQLVSEGIIVYGPHWIIEQNCGGYPIEFRISSSLAKKPNIVGSPLDSSFNTSHKWGPGSDMYCPDARMKLCTLNDTHDLALNLFCLDRPQFLLLTLESLKRQHEPLDLDDFKAALQLLRDIGDVYVIYNCGEKAGCSRVHKHLQGLRGPPKAFGMFIGGSEEREKIPFRHFVHRFGEGFGAASAARLLEVYTDLLGEARKSLGLADSQSACPHNLILWRDWMIVIPRKAAWLRGASANAGGMMGSVWVADRNTVDEWLTLGCRNVLEHLGVPCERT